MDFSGLHVLAVEDESMVAFMIEDMLNELGCTADFAWRVPQGVEMADRGHYDLALLDVNLAGETVRPVALKLRERGVPIVFASGYGSAAALEGFEGTPTVGKPFVIDDLRKAFSKALGKR